MAWQDAFGPATPESDDAEREYPCIVSGLPAQNLKRNPVPTSTWLSWPLVTASL